MSVTTGMSVAIVESKHLLHTTTEIMTDKEYELNIANCEAHRNHDSEAYFNARPDALNTEVQRRMFDAGYERGWQACSQHYEARIKELEIELGKQKLGAFGKLVDLKHQLKIAESLIDFELKTEYEDRCKALKELRS